MGNLGRHVQSYKSGYDDHIAAAGDIEWLFVGATIDWDTVTAAAADVTLGSGRLIRAGQKYLPRGQFMTRISAGGATVATENNTPTGGTFTLTLTTPSGAFTTAAQAYNATGATLQTAVRALDSRFAAATVTGSAGGPYTFGFPASLGSVQVTADYSLLTGAGAQPTITFATTSTGRVGWFGPYDPAATDGRATIARGDCGLIPRTIVLDGTLGLGERDDVHKGLITGGTAWEGRVIQSGTATHTLALGPTRAELLAGLPTLVLAKRAY
jgi:hypothetical protein